MPNELGGHGLKRAGQKQVSRNERAEWREKAMGLLREYAVQNPVVTGDAYHRYCTRHGLGEPHHANVWGTLLTAAHKANWLVPTNKQADTNRREARGRQGTIWKSALYAHPDEAEAAVLAAEDTELPDGDIVEEGDQAIQAVRYELRAAGRAGRTYKSKVNAIEAVEDYAQHQEVEVEAVKVFVYVPVLLRQ